MLIHGVNGEAHVAAVGVGYNNRLPAEHSKPKRKPLSGAQRTARARKAARARWGPAKRPKKNAAASALAKLRWASVSDDEIRASVSKMVAAKKRRKNSDR